MLHAAVLSQTIALDPCFKDIAFHVLRLVLDTRVEKNGHQGYITDISHIKLEFDVNILAIKDVANGKVQQDEINGIGQRSQLQR